MASGYSKEATRTAYARVAWLYDAWGALTETKALKRVRQLAAVKDGEAVLEVAVGTGRNFARIVAANPHGRNEGIDLSPAMLARAKRRLRGVRSADLLIGDAYRPPYASASFDVVINTYMLDLLPEGDLVEVLRGFRRVLRPGGRLVLATMAPGKRWYSRFWNLLARHAPALLTGCSPTDPVPALEAAGFRDIRKEYLTQCTFPSFVLSAKR